jgi:hypothetical protein
MKNRGVEKLATLWMRHLALPISHSFQVVVDLTEILTGVVDGLELHGFKERGTVTYLVVAPFFY